MVANDLRTSAQLTLDRADVVGCQPLDFGWRCDVPPLVEEDGPVMVVLADNKPLPSELWFYAWDLSTLLGGHLRSATVPGDSDPLIREGLDSCDLAILGPGPNPLLRRLLTLPVEGGATAPAEGADSFAVLAVQKPRWPLERILLVLCGGDTDQAAVDWAVRLARPSAAAVTILAVVPSVQAMYHGLARMRQDLRSALSTDTALGRQMRETAQRLVEAEVSSALRLRQGPPEQEICREMAEGGYDLAIMATRPCRWWLRQLKGDPICSLLRWADRPILFVEPKN